MAAGRAAASMALSALGLPFAFGSAGPVVGLEARGVSPKGCAIAGSCAAAIASAEGEGEVEANKAAAGSRDNDGGGPPGLSLTAGSDLG